MEKGGLFLSLQVFFSRVSKPDQHIMFRKKADNLSYNTICHIKRATLRKLHKYVRDTTHSISPVNNLFITK